MLAAMLGSHPDLAAGPETQFFSKLSHAELQDAVDDTNWPNKAVQLLSKLTLAEQSVLSLFETSTRKTAQFLEARNPGVSAMLETLTVPYAEARSAMGWVEKTPNHILHLETLRAIWPQAVIVRIIRDPRDVGLSMRRLPSFSDELLPNIYLWQRWNAQAESFLAADTKSVSLRYEDLVEEPEKHLRRICELAELAFDPAMLDFSQAAADVSSANEKWKAPVASGLSQTRKYAWRSDLPDEWREVCDLICYELLTAHGYEAGRAPTQTRTAFRMSRRFVEKQQNALQSLAKTGVRWMPSNDPLKADRLVDHPEHYRFSNPIKLARLAHGRAQARKERMLAR